LVYLGRESDEILIESPPLRGRTGIFLGATPEARTITIARIAAPDDVNEAVQRRREFFVSDRFYDRVFRSILNGVREHPVHTESAHLNTQRSLRGVETPGPRPSRS
jgi:hypothetical protein